MSTKAGQPEPPVQPPRHEESRRGPERPGKAGAHSAVAGVPDPRVPEKRSPIRDRPANKGD